MRIRSYGINTFFFILIGSTLLSTGCSKILDTSSKSTESLISSVTLTDDSGPTVVGAQLVTANVSAPTNLVKTIIATSNTFVEILASDIGLTNLKTITLHCSYQETRDPILQSNEALEGSYRYIRYLPINHEVVVAVVDSGVDFSHPDLTDQQWINTAEIANNGIDDDHNGYVDDVHGWDFSRNTDASYHPEDTILGIEAGIHGTEVAGTLGAKRSYTYQAGGINSKCKMMNLRTYNGLYDVQCIRYAADNGAQIINCSFATPGFNSSVKDAIDYALGKGCLVVAGAGNETKNLDVDPMYPAAYDNVVAVTGPRVAGSTSPLGNYGPNTVAFVAPYFTHRTTTPRGGYDDAGGTSFSSPNLAGIASRLLAYDNTLTRSQVLQLMIQYSIPVQGVKYGEIDVKSLVENFGYTFESKDIGVELSGQKLVLEFEVCKKNGQVVGTTLLYIYHNNKRHFIFKEVFPDSTPILVGA